MMKEITTKENLSIDFDELNIKYFDIGVDIWHKQNRDHRDIDWFCGK